MHLLCWINSVASNLYYVDRQLVIATLLSIFNGLKLFKIAATFVYKSLVTPNLFLKIRTNGHYKDNAMLHIFSNAKKTDDLFIESFDSSFTDERLNSNRFFVFG